MKIKSLLLAGLFASMCLSASAYDETTSYLSINGGDPINSPLGYQEGAPGLAAGDEIYVPIYMINEGQLSPKNLEFALLIPEGLTPSATEAISPSETLVQGRARTPMLTPNFSFHEEAWRDESGTDLPARSLKVVLQNSTGNNSPIDVGAEVDVCFLICTVDDEITQENLEIEVLPPVKFACEGGTVQYSEGQATTVKLQYTAVDSVKGDKAVAGVKYYNVAGVESNVPFDGVNIKVTKYADGTTKAVKVVK